MLRHAIGLHFADDQVWVAFVRRRRKTGPPELLGWHSTPHTEWAERACRSVFQFAQRQQCCCARAVPLEAVYFRSAALAGSRDLSAEELAVACCRELSCQEKLLVDVAVDGDGKPASVAVAKEAFSAALRRECGTAEKLVGSLALELPALFGLLRLSEPGAASGRVAMIHVEPNRCLAGVFVKGAPRALNEYTGMPTASRMVCARDWIEAGEQQDCQKASTIFVSGLDSARCGAAERNSFAEREVEWCPIESLHRTAHAALSYDARLATAVGLAVSALDPVAPSSINLLRSEAAAAAERMRRISLWGWSARAALWSSLAISACLLADAARLRDERINLAQQEAILAQDRTKADMRSEVRRVEQVAVQELRSAALAPLSVGEKIKAILPMIPAEARVVEMRLRAGSTEIRGVASGSFRGVSVAQLVSRSFPGSQVEAQESGEFLVKLLDGGDEVRDE